MIDKAVLSDERLPIPSLQTPAQRAVLAELLLASSIRREPHRKLGIPSTRAGLTRALARLSDATGAADAGPGS